MMILTEIKNKFTSTERSKTLDLHSTNTVKQRMLTRHRFWVHSTRASPSKPLRTICIVRQFTSISWLQQIFWLSGRGQRTTSAKSMLSILSARNARCTKCLVQTLNEQITSPVTSFRCLSIIVLNVVPLTHRS